MKIRKLLFIAATVIILLALAFWMFIIGRGHTVYFDNKTFELTDEMIEKYNIDESLIKVDDAGVKTLGAFEKVIVNVKGEQVAKLAKRERGFAECMGQNFTMSLIITEKKGDEELPEKTYTMKLPYNLDGIVISLPAYLAGLPEEVYLTEFVSLATTVEDTEEDVTTDEFGDDFGGDFELSDI